MVTLSKRIRWSFRELIANVKTTFEQIKYNVRGGFRCSRCGTLMLTRGNDISGTANGSPLMLTSYHTHPRCAQCTLELIERYFMTSPFGFTKHHNRYDMDRVVMHECDWTKNVEVCISGIMKYNNPLAQQLDLDVRFGSYSWNGFFVSLTALREMFCNGQYGLIKLPDTPVSVDLGYGVKAKLKQFDVEL